MRWLTLVLIVLAGCGKTTKPASIVDAGPELAPTRASVVIYDHGAPASGRVAVFHDAGGSVLATVRTGADGKATGPVPMLGKGMVTVERGGGLLTVTGVGPNETVAVGDRPGPDAGVPAEPMPPSTNPSEGKLVVTHPPAVYTLVRADFIVDDIPDIRKLPRNTTALAAETSLPYRSTRAPSSLTFRIELSSPTTSDRAILARRLTITLPELDIDLAVELPAQVSNATVEPGIRPTIHWSVIGDATKVHRAVYQLGRWTVIAAPGATAFQFPALPDELAGARPDASAKPGVALVEDANLGGYEPDRTDWLRDFTALPERRESYRIAMTGPLTF